MDNRSGLSARDAVAMATTTEPEILRRGDLEVVPGMGLVRVHGQPLALSVRELSLLAALLRRQGSVVSRSELYAEVWGGELRPEDRSVDVYVHKLRVKLGALLGERPLIHTHFGFGYRV
jgi:two-component system, OmpR family, copper resistance phosphate regulon response regulator CusR